MNFSPKRSNLAVFAVAGFCGLMSQTASGVTIYAETFPPPDSGESEQQALTDAGWFDGGTPGTNRSPNPPRWR